jgi:cyclitol oxidoreductase
MNEDGHVSATADPDLKGRSILLTGGSSGIGRAILDELLETEAHLAVVSRRDPMDWPGVTRPATDRFFHIRANLADTRAIVSGIDHALQPPRSSFDTVIQCAATYGNTSRHPFIETEDAEWAELINVNASAQFHVLKAVYSHLSKVPRALILHITSDVATQPGPGRIAYASSKAAAHAMYAGLAKEQGNSGISVVQIMPLRQVQTPGIERRRPPGFDFAGYSQPSAFRGPVMNVIRTFGAGMNGRCLCI